MLVITPAVGETPDGVTTTAFGESKVIDPAPTPSASPAAAGNCSVFTTLEVFDLATGSTVALTSDTRLIGQAGPFAVISPVLR